MKMEWISVKDRLPEYDPNDIRAFKYLIRAENERYYTGFSETEYNETFFYQHSGRKIKNVTHWMPLPEPPKE